jgi:valyl-tRNA synthetase
LKEGVIKKDLRQTPDATSLSLADRWILSRFHEALSDFTASLESYKINEAANRIYEFLWHEFCDWYLEIAKLSIDKPATQVTLYNVLEKSLRVLHPIMPFITEEIWQLLPKLHKEKSIMISSWPHVQKEFISKKIDGSMEIVINAIQAIRNLRSVWHIDPAKEMAVFIKIKNKHVEPVISENISCITKLGRVSISEMSAGIKKPNHSAAAVFKDLEIFLPLEGIIDIEKEKLRLSQKVEEITGIIGGIDKKLKNKNFTEKAPKEVIENEKERKTALCQELEGLRKNLKEL